MSFLLDFCYAASLVHLSEIFALVKQGPEMTRSLLCSWRFGGDSASPEWTTSSRALPHVSFHATARLLSSTVHQHQHVP